MTKSNKNFRQQSLNDYSHSKSKNDEYYTLRETVEYIFEKLIGYEFLKYKIIYCPCDDERSEFVKYLNENKNEINYKDFWYTSDDFNTHIDLIQKADLVITNPPFSKIRREYFPLMKKYAKNYFFFHSPTRMYIYKDEDVFIYKSDIDYYTTSFDDIINTVKVTKDKVYVSTIFVSSFKCNQLYNHKFPIKTYSELYKDKEPIYAETQEGLILNIDKLEQIPIDYDGQMLVPITVLYNFFKQHFDIIPHIPRYDKYTDEKSRFARILVKWKIKI